MLNSYILQYHTSACVKANFVVFCFNILEYIMGEKNETKARSEFIHQNKQ